MGWHVANVEKWVPGANIRRDAFGCFDLIVVPRQGVVVGPIVGVQACAGSSHAIRAAKVKAAPVLKDWTAAGGHAEVWSWSKRGAQGKRKLWTLRTESIKP